MKNSFKIRVVVRSFCFGLILSPPLAWIAKNGIIRALFVTLSPFGKRYKRRFLNWYLIFDIISNWYTLLNTKRRISLRGSFVKSKEKHLKQGEKIANLKDALQNLIHLPLTICKRTLKRIYKKNLQKQNMWCKRGPKY